MKKQVASILIVLWIASVASADLIVLRDLTNDTDLSPRSGVTSLGRDATGSFFEGTNDGYNTVDANIMHGGAFLDITDDTIQVELFYDDVNGGADLGFWVRMYAGTWDGTQYNYLGWANFACVVPNDGQWHTFTKAVADFEEPFGDPYNYSIIYKYRVDAVRWASTEPFTFGMGSIPEPASLSLLALGGLAVLRRR